MIDGYAHCGLSKYRPVEDVLDVMRSAGVDRAVLCQPLLFHKYGVVGLEFRAT
jgi:hypothetical protein